MNTRFAEAVSFLRRHFVPAALITLLLLAAVTAALSETSEVTDMPGTLQLDPLNGEWKQRVVPKQRLFVNYRNSNMAIDTIMATGETASTDVKSISVGKTLSGYNNRTNGDTTYVFAQAGTEGKVPGTMTISPDFYGYTSFDNVPQGVLVNSRLLRVGGGQNDCKSELWLSMITKDGELGNVKISPKLEPIHSLYWKGDGQWYFRPELDRNTAHDIAAYDWNSDGYSDYLITYIAAKDNGDVGYPRAMLILVDGKSLYKKMTGKSAADPKIYYVNGEGGSEFSTRGNVVGGMTDVNPSNSYRMTIGDFDGDGVPEAAICYAKISGSDAGTGRFNVLEIYGIKYETKATIVNGKEEDTSTCTFSNFFTHSSSGSTFMQNDSLGIAAGDLNGDGADELVQVYVRTKRLYEHGAVLMHIFGRQGDKDKFSRILDAAEIGTTYAQTKLKNSVSPINMAIGDFDSDGHKELAWIACDKDNKTHLNVYIQAWNGVLNGPGTQYAYSTSDLCKWSLNGDDYLKHSLCVGKFTYPESGSSPRDMLAIAQMGNNSSSTSGMANLDYGVFSWDKTNKLKCVSSGSSNGVQSAGNCAPIVTAADLHGESLVLGSPTVITLEDNIELVTVTQAPPKHWDKVSADGSALTGYADANGDVTLDAFSLFNTEDYNVTMKLKKTFGSTKSKTKVSEGGIDVGGSYVMDSRQKLLGKVFANNGEKDPILDIGLDYAREEVHNNTSKYSSSVGYTFTYAADRDDQLYYREDNYNICRYPVLLPESKRYIISEDADGKETHLQYYIQVIVPTKVSAAFSPSQGRGIPWYEPMHDNYNLFTYPKRLKDITGYPQGTAEKKKIDEYDPWQNINGKVFAEGGDTIGGSKFTFEHTASTSSGTEQYDSIRNTLAGHVYFHPQFGKVTNLVVGDVITKQYLQNPSHLKIDLDPHGTWGTESLTTTDASKMLSVTMNWPGTNSYLESASNDWTAKDLAFYAHVSYFTQDDGALCLGFAIPELAYGIKDSASKLWSHGSPYMTHPDPGLLLPLRWDTDIKKKTVNDSAGDHGTRGYCLLANTNPSTSHQMRGLTFTDMTSGDETLTGTASDKLSLKALKMNTEYKISLRVINYSFVNSQPVVVRFYKQPYRGKLDYPAADPKAAGSGCTEIGFAKIVSLAGRNNVATDMDNWSTVRFNYTTPNTEGRMWLHAVIEYEGPQLNKDNDHGWSLLGIYDPEKFAVTSSDSVADSSVTMTTDLASSAYPDIKISGVTAYEITEDASGDKVYTVTPINSAARGKKLRIDAEVEFIGGKISIAGRERDINHLPLLRAALISGGDDSSYGGIMGAQELPLIDSGESHTFSFVYDPALCTTSNRLTVRAFSPLLFASEQSNTTNQTVVLWDAEKSGGSGGSGCSAGFGVLALLALLPLALRKKK